MADVYTPTKNLDGNIFRPNLDTESPASYVPTPIDAPTSSSSHIPAYNPSKHEDQTTRQKYGVSDTYSPSNPAIRIVKRKPKQVAETPTATTATTLGKRRATVEDGEDPAVAALRLLPIKGILRPISLYNPKREKRKIWFADTRQLPLVHIKEIERIASIHANIADYRCSEKNEGAVFSQEMDDYDEVEWGMMKVKTSKVLRTGMSVTGKREEKRIMESGVMRGAMFGSYTLQCDPELNDLAATDLAESTPIKIPTERISSDQSSTLSALRDLPLPGRHRLHHQIHHPEGQKSQGILQMVPPVPVIQQVFQEAPLPTANYYTAVPETNTTTPPPATATTTTESRFELPANLKEMLSQLKKKNLISTEDSAPAPTPIQPTTSPFVTAMQTAQQMMQYQDNVYSSVEASQDAPMNGYVATFATPEMMAEERRQNSRNSEGWTQSGWKIQEPCIYFMYRPAGCNRGNECRFMHDEELRRLKMAEAPQRGFNHHREHDDRSNYRGGDRRGRGSFRGNSNYRGSNPHYQDRDLRDQNAGPRNGPAGPRVSRFDNNDGGYRGGRGFNLGGFGGARGSSRFDKKDTYDHQYQHHAPLQSNDQRPRDQVSNEQRPNDHHDGPSPPKRVRSSRFDQREDDGTTDVDHRPARRSRFDTRPHRSRFDQPADQDDRSH